MKAVSRRRAAVRQSPAWREQLQQLAGRPVRFAEESEIRALLEFLYQRAPGSLRGDRYNRKRRAGELADAAHMGGTQLEVLRQIVLKVQDALSPSELDVLMHMLGRGIEAPLLLAAQRAASVEGRIAARENDDAQREALVAEVKAEKLKNPRMSFDRIFDLLAGRHRKAGDTKATAAALSKRYSRATKGPRSPRQQQK